MGIKRGIVFLFVCMIGLYISGCGKNSSTLSCTLNVVASYSGYGEDGKDLGSGTFTDTFTVYAGDEFYELTGGHWNNENQKNDDGEIIISIKEINNVGVIIIIDGEELSVKYNSPKHIESRYVVFDGLNYEYRIRFTQDKE